MRYKVTLSYNGLAYKGWQIQPNHLSVQELVENALSTALQQNIKVVGAGRTDTGVHASYYVAHFDSEVFIEDLSQLVFKCNTLLPKDIAFQKIEQVKDDFHARFDAKHRSYRYQITQNKNPFVINSAYYIKRQLDLNQMNASCEILKKHQNFKAFSKVKTNVYTYHCNIFEAEWKLERNLICFDIKANRFLRNMVRAIVGTMIEVGLQTLTLKEFNQIIIDQDRRNAGKSVPAHALFLTDIGY
ncbi:tRNA pseudouridine38-40 synthase [Psychroflexus salarius]|uniref:tRNA pseudouridine synthase A n=1 Tax=Psychroflexus salarius TaxID=1155689 RepID=A0A1M4S8W1_9FLAO|nr:tRNA pseudouridine(38-40) synthase TruA [Psychroflexus salarius]SHE28595.1 tRNA pseudouridine38-40 synthase [Psychroflexus salarius]